MFLYDGKNLPFTLDNSSVNYSCSFDNNQNEDIIQNQYVIINDFTIEFNYDNKMTSLLNFQEVHSSICDYLKLHYNKNLKIEIKTLQLNDKIERIVKVEIINIIENLSTEKITKNQLHSKLNDFYLHISFFIKLKNILTNQEKLLKIFDCELNEKFQNLKI